MTQQIETIQQLDGVIDNLDAQLSALNMEFLNALNAPNTTSKTPLEIAATVIDKARGLMGDKANVERRKGLVQQLVTAAFAPLEFTDRETALKDLADRVRQLSLEVQTAALQATAAKSRAEATRGRTIEALRTDGLSVDDINRLNDEIQRAKAR